LIRLIKLGRLYYFFHFIVLDFFELDINIKSLLKKNKINVTLTVVTFIKTMEFGHKNEMMSFECCKMESEMINQIVARKKLYEA